MTAYLIPTRNWDGRINGGQVRPREGGCYRWLTGCHLPLSEEMPLHVIPGDSAKPVYLVEGIGAKHLIIQFDTSVNLIGAAGGNLASAPAQLQVVLKRAAGQKLVLLLDGETTYNEHVLTSTAD